MLDARAPLVFLQAYVCLCIVSPRTNLSSNKYKLCHGSGTLLDPSSHPACHTIFSIQFQTASQYMIFFTKNDYAACRTIQKHSFESNKKLKLNESWNLFSCTHTRAVYLNAIFIYCHVPLIRLCRR